MLRKLTLYLIFIAALILGTPVSQATVNVTGNLITTLGTPLEGSAFVRIRLRNFSPNVPTGCSGVIAEPTFDVYPDATGLITTTACGNNEIAPANTYYTLEFWNNGTMKSSAHYFINTGGTFNFNSASPINTFPPQQVWSVVLQNPPAAQFVTQPGVTRFGANRFDITENQDFTDVSTPGNPSAGKMRVYSKSGNLCQLTPAGVETCGLGGGAVAGSDTQVIFNNSGAYAGDAGLTYNFTTDVLNAVGGFTENGSAVPNALDHLGFFSPTTSAQLGVVLTDETGSGGGFVRATNPTIDDPIFTTKFTLPFTAFQDSNNVDYGSLDCPTLPTQVSLGDDEHVRIKCKLNGTSPIGWVDFIHSQTNGAGVPENEWVHAAYWHPAILIQNLSTTQTRSSILWAYGPLGTETRDWMIQVDTSNNATRNFQILQKAGDPTNAVCRLCFTEIPTILNNIGVGTSVQTQLRGNINIAGFVASEALYNDTTGRAAFMWEDLDNADPVWFRKGSNVTDVELCNARDGGTCWFQFQPDSQRLMLLENFKINFGVADSNHVMLKPNTNTLEVRRGDDSLYGGLTARSLGLHRSAGNTAQPDLFGDGTNAFVGAGKADGTGEWRFGVGTAVSVAATLSVGDGSGNDFLTATPEATNPSCAGGQYRIWANSVDGKWKKCQNGVVSDLDIDTDTTVPHNFLSTSHPDTVAATPTRGGIIVGNSTPAWSRLTLGNGGTVLAAGALDPLWRYPFARKHATDCTALTDGASNSLGNDTCWEEDDNTIYVCEAGDGTCNTAGEWTKITDNTGAGGGYATIEDEGSGLTQRTILNFVGAGVSCADDTTRTTCTISGGGSGNAFTTIGAAIADSSSDTLTVTDSATIDFTTTNDPEDLTAVVVANSINATHIDETVAYALSSGSNTFVASTLTFGTTNPADIGQTRFESGQQMCWEGGTQDFCITGTDGSGDPIAIHNPGFASNTPGLYIYTSFGEVRLGQKADLECGDSRGFYGLYVHDNMSSSWGPDCVSNHQAAFRGMKVVSSTTSNPGEFQGVHGVVGVGTTGTQSDSTGIVAGVWGTADFEAGAGHTATEFYGLYSRLVSNELGTSDGTITDAAGLFIKQDIALATTVTNLYGMRVEAFTGDASFTNLYGFRIGKQSGATNAWGGLIEMGAGAIGLQLENPDTPSDNTVQDSPLLRLTAVYDSDGGAPVVRATRHADIIHNITATTPTSQLDFSIGGTVRASILDAGVLDVQTGFRIGNAAASGNYLRGNGTNFVSSAIQEGDIPAALARDSEINVQGTANEITSSGSGVAPTLSIASTFRITGKTATAPNKTGTATPGTCTVGDTFFDTDATAGLNLFGCTATDTWTLLGDGGGGGGGDNLSVNGVAAADADLDDATPAAPANGFNVRWQKDAGTPNNISAHLLTTDIGSTTFGSGSAFTWTFNGGGGTDPALTFNAADITSNSVLLGPDGAVGAPAYSFSGDPDTGIYRSSTNIVFTIDGTIRSAIRGGFVSLRNDGEFNWNATGTPLGTIDLRLTRDSADTLQQGLDSATPTAQTFKGPDGAGTDIAGASLAIAGGRGTGTGAGGSVLIQTATAGTTGSGQNSLTTRLTIDTANLTSTLPVLVPDGTATNPTLAFSSEADYGFYKFNSTNIGMTVNGVARCAFGSTTGNCRGDWIWAWSAGSIGSVDTGISRTAAGALAVGNGTASNASGTLNMATLQTGGTSRMDSSGVMTNTTFDAESTGNVLTIVSEVEFHAAVCIGAAASLNADDTPNLTEPAAACETHGSSPNGITHGVAAFDQSTDEGILLSYDLPSTWASAESVDITFIWHSGTTTNSVVWGVRTSCRADAEVFNATWNTANTVTDAAKGTANQRNEATISGITMTGCAAGEELFLEVFRDADNGSDNHAADALLTKVKLRTRLAQ